MRSVSDPLALRIFVSQRQYRNIRDPTFRSIDIGRDSDQIAIALG